jgi:hypothetical protein
MAWSLWRFWRVSGGRERRVFTWARMKVMRVCEVVM